MMPGTLDYGLLADLHRPENAHDFAPAVRALATQGLRAHDIAAALRLTAAAVIQLLDQPHSGGNTMNPDPRSSAPALAGGPNNGDLEQREAAQELHAREAAGNVEKWRQPSQILTDDERKVLERSKGVA